MYTRYNKLLSMNVVGVSLILLKPLFTIILTPVRARGNDSFVEVSALRVGGADNRALPHKNSFKRPAKA